MTPRPPAALIARAIRFFLFLAADSAGAVLPLSHEIDNWLIKL